MKMNKARAGSPIWPVGCRVAEPMSSQEVAVRCGIVRAYRCLGVDDVAIERLRPGTLATFADDQRTRGIALAHERARARNERWLAWLRSADVDACADGLQFAARFQSPEAAVRAAASSPDPWDWHHVTWLHGEIGLGFIAFGDHCPACSGRRDDMRALARKIIASPEWLSLPWQRDPSEVANG